MNPSLIDAITKSPLRTSFYHFTRAVNLPAMAAFDTIYSSAVLSPAHAAGERRAVAHRVSYAGQAAILNAHLRITPKPWTQAQRRRNSAAAWTAMCSCGRPGAIASQWLQCIRAESRARSSLC